QQAHRKRQDMSDGKILIAGGGIGGFAAALALSQKGRAVHLIEQAPDYSEVGAGIQIGPNVFKMFEVLGLTDAIMDVAVIPDALVMMDGLNGQQITRIPLNNEEFYSRFKYPYGVIYRPDLHNALIEAAKASPLVELTVNQKVVDFEDDGSKVRAICESGKIFEGDALIAADGLWSKIRAKIVGDGKPRVSGHIAYRAVLPTPEVPEHLRKKEVILWAGPKTHLVHYPLHRGEIFNLVAVFHSDRYEEGWDVFGDTEELKQRFAGEHENVQIMLDKIDTWKMWVLCDREPVRNWTKGRVTLLGDAAHPMLQYLAQGACMAIEDAVCLADRLDTHKGDYGTAFIDYQNSRYLRTGRVQLTARVYGDFYHAAGVTGELRTKMLSQRTPQQAYDGMRWLYEGIEVTGAQKM
ncbi:MAG TPA: 3-hydroxybenzoate 6-monooxygenase, partial [Hyphomicrobiales bacterium]|nr:3-hydroxybenzoate 6-monooxygenase [Hyphomicrobiales bacterium]